jgi:hypothetical protein
MFKIVCDKNDCANKGIIHYMKEATDPSMCGGCKQDIVPVEMSQQEFDEVFDYDPFAVIPMEGA